MKIEITIICNPHPRMDFNTLKLVNKVSKYTGLFEYSTLWLEPGSTLE